MRTTDYRYARPSFAGGVARIMDFGSTLGAYNASGAVADSAGVDPDSDPDSAALRRDWEVVGDDFRHAVGQFSAEESARLPADNTAAEG